MRDYYSIKLNLPGGIVSPGALHGVLTAALSAGVRQVQFGARQQLLLTVHAEQFRQLERDPTTGEFQFEVNTDEFPNVISSYCAEEVFVTGTWLSESTYQDVPEGFRAGDASPGDASPANPDFRSRLKINLSDNR